MSYRMLLCLPLLLAACACQSVKATFEVQVINAGTQPLCVGLVKRGGNAAEPSWRTPEELAMATPQIGESHWGQLVGPGESKVLGPQEGSFPAGTYAALRVYIGDRKIDELLAISRTDPDRLEIYLWPGRSDYTISNPDGKLVFRGGGQR